MLLHRSAAVVAASRATLAQVHLLESLEPRRLFAAGDLDTAFGGGDGQAIVPFSDATSARVDVMARQSDGKTILAGHRMPTGSTSSTGNLDLIRLEADGDLDPTFGGGDGVVELDPVANILQVSI